MKNSNSKKFVPATCEPFTIAPDSREYATWQAAWLKGSPFGFEEFCRKCVTSWCSMLMEQGRFPITFTQEEFRAVNDASIKKGLLMDDFVHGTVMESTYAINNKEQIENILDLRAFQKASRGGTVSYEEHQRSERYRESHPEEAAAADQKRPVETWKEMMLRDKPYDSAEA